MGKRNPREDVSKSSPEAAPGGLPRPLGSALAPQPPLLGRDAPAGASERDQGRGRGVGGQPHDHSAGAKPPSHHGFAVDAARSAEAAAAKRISVGEPQVSPPWLMHAPFRPLGRQDSRWRRVVRALRLYMLLVVSWPRVNRCGLNLNQLALLNSRFGRHLIQRSTRLNNATTPFLAGVEAIWRKNLWGLRDQHAGVEAFPGGGRNAWLASLASGRLAKRAANRSRQSSHCRRH